MKQKQNTVYFKKMLNSYFVEICKTFQLTKYENG